MIISDGTTDLTYTTTFTEPAFGFDQTLKLSSGGEIKSQKRGKRFISVEKVRVTGAELRTLLDLLTNESDFYYYTPTTVPDFMDTAEFPMKVSIENLKRSKKTWNGAEIYYIQFTVKSTRYLNESSS